MATPAVSIEAANTPVPEGTPLQFTVTTSRAPDADLTVGITLHETGAMLTDSAPREVTIRAGSTTETLDVQTVDDQEDEQDSTVTATLIRGTGYTVGTPAATEVVVSDNDDPASAPTVTITVGESTTSGGTTEFVVLAQPAPADDLIVNVTVTVTPAPSPGATGVTSHMETIRAGESTATLAVEAAVGSVVNAMLAPGMGYTVGTPTTARVTISDSVAPPPPPPTPPVVAIAAPSGPVQEGMSLLFTLTATPAPRTELTVDVTLSGTGDVLAQLTATGTIDAGVTTGTLRVTTIDDQMYEPDSTVTATLNGGTAYEVGDPDSATGEVTDDDDPASPDKPSVTISAVASQVSRGSPVQFTVTADPAPASVVLVLIDWSDVGNHLDDPPDSVTISGGSTMATLTAATVTDGSTTQRAVTAKLYSDHPAYAYTLGTQSVASVTMTN